MKKLLFLLLIPFILLSCNSSDRKTETKIPDPFKPGDIVYFKQTGQEAIVVSYNSYMSRPFRIIYHDKNGTRIENDVYNNEITTENPNTKKEDKTKIEETKTENHEESNNDDDHLDGGYDYNY